MALFARLCRHPRLLILIATLSLVPLPAHGGAGSATSTTTASPSTVGDEGGDESAGVFIHSAFTDSPITEGEVWPLPQKIDYGAQNRSVRPDSVVFTFRGVRDTDCDILSNARKTYSKQWFFPSKGQSATSGHLTVVIHQRKKCPGPNEYPQQGMNEEYRLRVPSSGDVTLEAEEVWGVLRGLETLSQLIYQVRGAYFLRTATIHDWPEYPVRGVLLDTSRHYLRKNLILRQIDILAQNKMNLLHWHIVDMESFPYQSRRYPNLSRAGAYTPKHIYSRSTIQEILNYSRLRGVRVMVEFDTPGHMSSWDGQFELLADCRNLTGYFMPPAMIDPSREKNFLFLSNFFREVLELFPESFIHLGGDEAEFWIDQCWGNNPSIRRFMESRGLSNVSALESYYFGRLQTIIAESPPTNANRRMVLWQEAFNRHPDQSAVIHVWKSRTPEEQARDIAQITAANHSVLLSACWYLNLINYGADWKEGSGKYYQCNPRAFQGTPEQKQLVLGGVATMWAEFVDGTNVEARLWYVLIGDTHDKEKNESKLFRPRASAVAERLWSSPTDTHDPEAAWPRLHELRCRLIARGFRAEPLNGPDHCAIEWDDPV